MSDSSVVTILEAVDRRVRITTTGIEIVTTFYVEPASGAPMVVCSLLGSVSGNTTSSLRNLPANDFEYPFCYCVEAHPAPFDRRSPSMLSRTFGHGGISRDTLLAALLKPIVFDGPSSLGSDGQYFAANSQNMCGAYVEAVYRPINSVYTGSTSGTSNANVFDYVDPQFYPCSRSFTVDEAGFLLPSSVTGLPQPVPNAGTGAQMMETWQEFTIRRVMCPCVPWETIRQLQNRINGLNAWTPANMTIPGLKNNTFPLGTLRFDSAEIIKRVLPIDSDSKGVSTYDPSGNFLITTTQQWWDILYKFSWRTTYSIWTDHTQTTQGPDYISWNCEWFNGINSTLHGLLPGWYEQTYFEPTNLIVLTKTRAKYLNACDRDLPIVLTPTAGATHPLDGLFLLNAP